MARIRRLRVESLAGARVGAQIELPAGETRHARVLRLAEGAELELFDGAGRTVAALLVDGGRGGSAKRAALHAVITRVDAAVARDERGIELCVAWPKGKRAALLVEKCTELGVTYIVPMRFERGVVAKDDASEGVARLRRVAQAAAKQCGRPATPEFREVREFAELLLEPGDVAISLILDPEAAESLAGAVSGIAPEDARTLRLVVGPEGGFTPDELARAESAGYRPAAIPGHVLRVETAAIAACAIARAVRRISTR